jgi:hypothetical protein
MDVAGFRKTKLDADLLKRLYGAVEWSDKKLDIFRKQRMDRLRMMLGAHHGENAAEDNVPLPLIELYVNIYARQLSSSAPQFLATSTHEELKTSAADLELALNHLVRNEINLSDTLRRWVVDALLGVGILKVGLAWSPNSEQESGPLHDPGQPFVDNILFEDLVLDLRAKRWEQIQYIGDRYTAPLEDVLANDEFNAVTRKKLGSFISARDLGREGETDSKVIERGRLTMDDEGEFIRQVELMDIWLPRFGLLVTLPAEHVSAEPLRVVEWDGPEHGPYHVLGFEEVPGNLLPLPPTALVQDMHDLSNRLFNKLSRQAERQKTVIGVQPAGDQDGQRVLEAGDGDMIPMLDPKNVAEINYGGPNQELFGYVVQLRQLFSYFSGNLDALGGLDAQSETVGQDRLLAGAASQRMREMQDRMVAATRKLGEDICFYLWSDPLIELPMVKRIEGTDISIPVLYTPERREGDFLQYNIDIEPYSMTSQSPSEKGSALTNLMMQVIVPLAPMMQQAGIIPNIENFLKLVAKYGNMPEVTDLVTFAEGEMNPQSGPTVPRNPAQTTRTNVRVNRSAGTMAGSEAVLSQLALGGNPQQSQRQSAVQV